MNYKYIDGLGNQYQIKDNSLKYTPMIKSISSSGEYDGGEPFIKELNRVDQMRLVDVLERAIWCQSDHIPTRQMGSGTIIKVLGDDITRVYLKRTSESNEEVNELCLEFK